MNDRQKKMIEKLGLKEEDFEPKKQSDSERIADLEDLVTILAEVALGGAE